MPSIKRDTTKVDKTKTTTVVSPPSSLPRRRIYQVVAYFTEISEEPELMIEHDAKYSKSRKPIDKIKKLIYPLKRLYLPQDWKVDKRNRTSASCHFEKFLSCISYRLAFYKRKSKSFPNGLECMTYRYLDVSRSFFRLRISRALGAR